MIDRPRLSSTRVARILRDVSIYKGAVCSPLKELSSYASFLLASRLILPFRVGLLFARKRDMFFQLNSRPSLSPVNSWSEFFAFLYVAWQSSTSSFLFLISLWFCGNQTFVGFFVHVNMVTGMFIVVIQCSWIWVQRNVILGWKYANKNCFCRFQ